MRAPARRSPLPGLAAALTGAAALAGAAAAAPPVREVRLRHPPPLAPARDSLRAFEGAPPVVPHAIDGMQRAPGRCLTCHTRERRLGRRHTIQVPHPERSSCLQCHVAVASAAWVRPKQPLASGFQPAAPRPAPGPAHPWAPPPVPHQVQGRETCAGCHTPRNPDPKLRVDHSHRRNCLQCHVPQATLEPTPGQ